LYKKAREQALDNELERWSSFEICGVASQRLILKCHKKVNSWPNVYDLIVDSKAEEPHGGIDLCQTLVLSREIHDSI